MPDIPKILSHFVYDGKVTECVPFGSGHINSTYRFTTDAGRTYILQLVNKHVFVFTKELMQNMADVTAHIAMKNGGDWSKSIVLSRTTDGKFYHIDDDGEYWRVMNFIDGICLDACETPNDFYQSAVAFGTFQRQLSDFPAETLVDTIPHFHDTPHRYAHFKATVKADKLGRAAGVQDDIKFYLDREETGSILMGMLKNGELPLRVTHNDTKLNNVILDKTTREPICVLDLDTVMPGLSAFDFGDSIRFGASTAAEDEPDLDKVHFDIGLFETYARGFIDACGDILTDNEFDVLPLGAITMTLECGMRFLDDYLDGDNYFKIHRPGQNLDRARTHIKLVSEMEAQLDDMKAIIARLKK